MDILTYALSRKYTDEAIASSGGGGSDFSLEIGTSETNELYSEFGTIEPYTGGDMT